jgi:hypothetical protein
MKAPSSLGFVLAFVVPLLAMLVLTARVASADYSTPSAWFGNCEAYFGSA